MAYHPATAEATVSTFHRRRTSSRTGLHAAPDGLKSSHLSSPPLGTTSFNEEDEYKKHMSLDRSPSPREGGGWASPGLNAPYEENTARSRGNSPTKSYGDLNGGNNVTWASAQARSARVKGQASYQSQNQGFFGRHMRRISEKLPYFAHGGQEDRYKDKEKLGRGRGWIPMNMVELKELPRRIALLISRRRKHVSWLVGFILLVVLWFNPSELSHRYGFGLVLLTWI